MQMLVAYAGISHLKKSKGILYKLKTKILWSCTTITEKKKKAFLRRKNKPTTQNEATVLFWNCLGKRKRKSTQGGTLPRGSTAAPPEVWKYTRPAIAGGVQ